MKFSPLPNQPYFFPAVVQSCSILSFSFTRIEMQSLVSLCFPRQYS